MFCSFQAVPVVPSSAFNLDFSNKRYNFNETGISVSVGCLEQESKKSNKWHQMLNNSLFVFNFPLQILYYSDLFISDPDSVLEENNNLNLFFR